MFGYSVAVSRDTVVIGADSEDSNATGINGNQSDNSAFAAGAAYVLLGPPLQSPTVSLLSTSLLLPSGSNITFSASAQGTSTIYFQWLRNSLPLTNDAFVSGANTPLLTIANLQPQHAGAYSVRVTNLAGSATSDSLVLTLTPPTRMATAQLVEIAFGLNPNNPPTRIQNRRATNLPASKKCQRFEPTHQRPG